MGVINRPAEVIALQPNNVFRLLSDKITADIGTAEVTFPSIRRQIHRERQLSVCVKEKNFSLLISWPFSSFSRS